MHNNKCAYGPVRPSVQSVRERKMENNENNSKETDDDLLLTRDLSILNDLLVWEEDVGEKFRFDNDDDDDDEGEVLDENDHNPVTNEKESNKEAKEISAVEDAENSYVMEIRDNSTLIISGEHVKLEITKEMLLSWENSAKNDFQE